MRVKVGLSSLVVLISLALPAAAQTCEICKKGVLTSYAWCRPVQQEETGATNCVDYSSIAGPYCLESGNFCSWVSVGGGGSGGGGEGGGGGSGCTGSGFCPAECFSCGGNSN